MKTTTTQYRRICFLALLGLFALPSIGAATPSEAAPVAAAKDDTGCKQAVVALDIDVATGEVYLVDSGGGLTLTDNDITVYFGSLTSVLVDLEFSSGDWDVSFSPTNGPVQTRRTQGGALRYWINASPSAYTLSATSVSGASVMMNMTPVVPDVILRPVGDCPPPT